MESWRSAILASLVLKIGLVSSIIFIIFHYIQDVVLVLICHLGSASRQLQRLSFGHFYHYDSFTTCQETNLMILSAENYIYFDDILSGTRKKTTEEMPGPTEPTVGHTCIGTPLIP